MRAGGWDGRAGNAAGAAALCLRRGKPATLLQGALCILAFAGLGMAATIGDTAVLGVGLRSTGLLLFCLAAPFLSSRYERRHVWSVVGGPAAAPVGDRPAAGGLLLLYRLVRPG